MEGGRTLIYIFFIIVFGFYFLYLFKKYKDNKSFITNKPNKARRNLKQLREDVLNFSESKVSSFDYIIGQKEGLKALRAAICNANPQHVIIYGPSGVGKTTATKIVLHESKINEMSPFDEKSKFIKIDARTLPHPSRHFADPLMGSVEEPIYQLGQASIPRPKPGVVTKAHGGILFLDEIGELHSIYMNKLLKVLKDRKVYLESAYYNPENKNIPQHIHKFFQGGLPADFKLVGVTTKSPGDLPLALRTLCKEIYFRPLTEKEIGIIIKSNCKDRGFEIEKTAIEKIKKHTSNGEEAVNILEIAISLALAEGRKKVILEDIEEIVGDGNNNPEFSKKEKKEASIGFVKGLASVRAHRCMVTKIEVSAIKLPTKGQGRIIVTGIIGASENKALRKDLQVMDTDSFGMANILDVIKKYFDVDTKEYDIHVNFINEISSDIYSIDIAIVIAIYSAIFQQPVDRDLAITGGLSIEGKVKEVDDIITLIKTAIEVGCSRVIIPKDSYKDEIKSLNIEVFPVEDIKEALSLALKTRVSGKKSLAYHDEIDFVAALGNNEKK